MSFSPRTINDIFSQLIAEKESFPSLTGLTETDITDQLSLVSELEQRQVSDWILWLYTASVGSFYTDISMQTAVDDITNIMNTQRLGTTQWWIEQALKFQYGDTVQIDQAPPAADDPLRLFKPTYQPFYPVVDATKRIIANCNIQSIGGKLIFKVRRTGTPSLSNILSNAELTAFNSYLRQIGANKRIQVNNYAPDQLTLNLQILYSGNLATVQSAVETAINNYLLTLEFDSKLYVNKLLDAIQVVPGVFDPRFVSGTAIDALGSTKDIQFEYTTLAGWCLINSSTPLSNPLYVTYTSI